MAANAVLAKKLDKWAYVISIVIFLCVLMMRRVKLDLGVDFSFLPPLHASLNAITAIVLLVALYFIKNKQVEAHKKAMTLALVLSFLFLCSYVLYHFTTPETSFCKEGNIRIIYFILLISHIILAAVILPMILLTFIRGYTELVNRHKKLAKWVFPIWLYVAVSGPIIYLMLKPCYGG
jgi:putative membrane protein